MSKKMNVEKILEFYGGEIEEEKTDEAEYQQIVTEPSEEEQEIYEKALLNMRLDK